MLPCFLGFLVFFDLFYLSFAFHTRAPGTFHRLLHHTFPTYDRLIGVIPLVIWYERTREISTMDPSRGHEEMLNGKG
jgi:hypothetical protein